MGTTTNDPAVLLADLQERVKRLADVLREREGDRVDLDVERFVRLAEYSLTHARTHAITGQETSEPMFGFVFTALAVLEPEDGRDYAPALKHEPYLAFDAIFEITEVRRREAVVADHAKFDGTPRRVPTMAALNRGRPQRKADR